MARGGSSSKKRKAKRNRPSSHARLGKIFEGEVSSSLKIFKRQHPYSFYWHRLADTMTYIKVPNVIIPKQPCDYIALYEGKFFGLEAKSTNADRFQLDYLKEHQKDGLKEIQYAGGKGFLIISFRKTRPVTAFLIDILDYLPLERRAIQEERKSIPREWIEESGLSLKRIPRIGFDLSPLFLT